MMASTSARSVRLRGGLEVSRVIKGGYQLSRQYGPATEAEDTDLGLMFAAAEAGLRTFDCGDIYIGVEEKIGAFLEAWQRQGREREIAVLTKFVPDFEDLPRLSGEYAERIIDRSLARLRLERLHMVQFHWWDYSVPGCLETLGHLQRLQQKGKIAHLGLTNFSARRTREILKAGIPIVSTQVQYSLLDRRPGGDLATLCAAHDVGMLCYGTLCGSFLSERWLGAAPPKRPFREKYTRIVDAVGGWEALQALLATLKRIADRHQVSIAAIAMRYVLEQPAVTSVIAGAHTPPQIEEARSALELTLDASDLASIDRLRASFPALEGDVFDLERDLDGRHGEIYRTRRSRHAESGGGVLA